MWRERITIDQNILVGKPIIKGTRLSVDFILDLLSHDWSNREILENYPQLTQPDIMACLEYASYIIKEEKVLIM